MRRHLIVEFYVYKFYERIVILLDLDMYLVQKGKLT